MSPAQRRKRLIGFSSRRKSARRWGVRWPFLLLAVFVLAFIFLSLNGKLFRADTKLSLVMPTGAGDILISTFDKSGGEINNLLIPGSTQLTTSRQLGAWKAKSLWQLGQNEKLGGKLLSETVAKDFHLPAAAWADTPAYGFASGGFRPIVRAVFYPYQTNLGLGDKIKLGIFSLLVKDVKRNFLNLEQTSYLKRTKLVDGEEGFLVTRAMPDEIIAIFSEAKASQGAVKLAIEDATGKSAVAEEVGKTIEVMGIKVTAISDETPADFDCSVSGSEESLIAKIAAIFSCEVKSTPIRGNFDIEIRLGRQFADRY